MADQITPHFSWKEFRSRDGKNVPLWHRGAVRELCSATLEVLRAEHGDRPFRIVSGWRSKEHNLAVGGARNSYHLRGRAADVYADDLVDLYWLALDAMRGGLIPQGGLAYYPSTSRRIAFLHIDNRGTIVHWRPPPPPTPPTPPKDPNA